MVISGREHVLRGALMKYIFLFMHTVISIQVGNFYILWMLWDMIRVFTYFASIAMQQALEEMAKKNNGKVTCPRTGTVCDLTKLSKAYIS